MEKWTGANLLLYMRIRWWSQLSTISGTDDLQWPPEKQLQFSTEVSLEMLPKKNATISTIFNPSTISWFTQLVAGRSLKKRTASLRSAAAGCCALRQSLNKVSRTGVPVVLTIHQPSSECLGAPLEPLEALGFKMLGQPVKIGVFNANRTMNHWIFLGLSHCKTHLYKKWSIRKTSGTFKSSASMKLA